MKHYATSRKKAGVTILAISTSTFAFGLFTSPAMAVDLNLGGVGNVKIAEPNKSLVDVQLPAVANAKVNLDTSDGVKAKVSLGNDDSTSVKVKLGGSGSSGGTGASVSTDGNKAEVSVGSGGGSTGVTVSAGNGSAGASVSVGGNQTDVGGSAGDGGVKVTVGGGKTGTEVNGGGGGKVTTGGEKTTTGSGNDTLGGGTAVGSSGGNATLGAGSTFTRSGVGVGVKAVKTVKKTATGSATPVGSGVSGAADTDVSGSADGTVTGPDQLTPAPHSTGFWITGMLLSLLAGLVLTGIGARVRRSYADRMLHRRIAELVAELDRTPSSEQDRPEQLVPEPGRPAPAEDQREPELTSIW
jgi:hypothetical protein